MRAMFLFLVAANLAFFAWWYYFSPPDSGRDPKPLAQQIEPRNLRILPPDGEAARPAEAPMPTPKPIAADAPPAACLEWGGFAAAEVARAKLALGPLAPGERLSQRRGNEPADWWVFIPPQGNRPGAQKKAAELKSLGFSAEEYFIVQDEGPSRWAVSLGVFGTEDAAKAQLEGVRGRGVRLAQVGAREAQVPKVWFQVRAVSAAQQGMLRELTAGFPGTELRACQ